MKKFYDEVKPVLDRVRAQNMESDHGSLGEERDHYSKSQSSVDEIVVVSYTSM